MDASQEGYLEPMWTPTERCVVSTSELPISRSASHAHHQRASRGPDSTLGQSCLPEWRAHHLLPAEVGRVTCCTAARTCVQQSPMWTLAGHADGVCTLGGRSRTAIHLPCGGANYTPRAALSPCGTARDHAVFGCLISRLYGRSAIEAMPETSRGRDATLVSG